ncbi:decaprenyl-phosphate phosphoribosyltransferase [Reichenbachiella ulvae]|uniref:Decaprenyl-phosphate phosphoribosyltransferase n=1 Tax=Reichenbachiella ulvae TaxID=2980104 RepID=A0ABT3CN60_9BACT|nr:decaprenyl-phosphate phosphoribosyltransferase [Reichenbachiella ulvae]MCV9385022.1 decaprenyl-phosphate phosphoribosyltransferase [Reichenbachiella ulvae]
MKVLKLIRIKHWVKNSFLFIPLFFSGQLTDYNLYPNLLLGFLAFSLIASAIYVINDLKDVEADRLHPKKKERPIASGDISISAAIMIFGLLVLSGGTIAYLVELKFAFVLLIYFLMNLAYTLKLKEISIIDIVIVAIGFVLRIKAGGIISDVPLSQWIIVMVFLLAVLMAVAKRRDDLIIKQESGQDMRKVAKTYSLEFLNVALSLVAGVIFVSYLMYCMSPEVIERMGTYRLFYTALFVLVGILRYLQLGLVENDTGSPTQVLYKDRFIQMAILGWVVSFYLLIYFKDLTIFS